MPAHRAPGITAYGSPQASSLHFSIRTTWEVFDQLIPALRARNVQFVGGVFEDKEMAVRSFIVKDNTGNPIQFFARSGDRK